MFEALSQHGAGQPLQNPKWEQLPPEIVQHIAWRLFSPECHSLGTLRLVCKSWRADLPAGLFPGLTMWQWEEDHGKCISQTTQDIRVSAPMLREDTLLALAPACPTLRSLTLDWIALPALRAAAPLFPHLKDLKASIYFGMHPNPETESLWLDWVPSLALLERLDLEAALEYDINSQMGLVYLKKLRKLRVLKLKNCAIMDDAVIPHLTCLENLAELSLVPSFFSADGLGVLCSSLPDLTIFGGCHKDCESAMKALTISKLETFNVKLHLGAVEAADFWTSGAKLLPSVTSFELLQENFKGGVPASFIGAAPLPQLRTLRLLGVEVGPTATEAIGAHCRSLRDLVVAFHHSVRDESLLTWTSLTHVTALTLRGTWFLSEYAVSKILHAMRDMEVLNLYHLQGEVKFMLEGLTAMPRLRTLKISMCRLAGPAFLDDILIAVGHSLRSLTVRWCGSACEVAEAVAAALPCMPALKHLGMTFQGPMEPSAVILLATAIASCHDLHTLDIQLTQGYFSAGPFGVTVPIPVWQQVTALKNLTSLTVAAALGWREDALAAVCASSTGLTQVRLCDGRRCITNDWVGHIGRLPRLMDLKLEWCQELEVGVLDALSLATALTQLRTFRCTGVDDADAVHALRAALPTLVMCNMH